MALRDGEVYQRGEDEIKNPLAMIRANVNACNNNNNDNNSNQYKNSDNGYDGFRAIRINLAALYVMAYHGVNKGTRKALWAPGGGGFK